ncbi:hypothetical protein OBBRIDRAFT_526513 [Obba rivulosa]|uniref:F-box domain-containing protein n=1 Tax=Obba rivulosa TaxID=1052685 RepID=A0A8E2DLT5_9APHY|nr:hypothetical protein OBBRIDRAFT_526513 [Obba rivulosa]
MSLSSHRSDSPKHLPSDYLVLMHRCLSVAEIVRVITDHLPASDTYGRAALASLARTCRTLHEPALDALWYHQDDLFNILRCLPSDSWTFGQDELPPGTIPGNITYHLRITRPLSPADWIRFDTYALRVKSFGTMYTPRAQRPRPFPPPLPSANTKPDFTVLTMSVFIELSLRRSSSPVFPKLRHLCCTRTEYMGFFLSTSLTCLKFSFESLHWDNTPLPLICSLPKSCSRLQELEILDDSVMMCPAIIRIVGNLPLLRCFSFKWSRADDLAELLRSLQTVPMLQTVRMHCGEQYGRLLSQDPLDTARFSAGGSLPAAIRSLQINDTRPENFPRLLQVLQPRGLHRVHFALHFPRRIAPEEGVPASLPETLERTLTMLKHCSDCSVLESILVQYPTDDPLPDRTDWVWSTTQINRYVDSTACYNIQHIQPLLSFHNLITVDIRVHASMYLDDNALEVMAISWPRLQVLNLNGGIWPRAEVCLRVTLRAVTHLALHCADLVGFSLAINCLDVERQCQTLPQPAPPHGKLRWIQLGESRLGNTRSELVDFLLRWFPGLEWIRNSTESDRTWKTIIEETRIAQRDRTQSFLLVEAQS